MAINFPDIDPIALQIGPLAIRWYALAYLAGILLGWRYALHIAGLDKDAEGKNRFLPHEKVDDFLAWAVLGIVAGGRLGYVLFYQPQYYLTHPLEILHIWNGGMSFHGGALGVIAAMIAYCYRQKLPLLRFTDMTCAAVPIGLFFGRLANFVNGELYGRPTDAPWGVVFPFSDGLPRHPSQLYEAILEGLVLWGILFFLIRNEKIRSRPGIVSGVFLAGYALARMAVETVREPDSYLGFIVGALTMGQLLSVPMILGGLLLVYLAFRAAGKAPS